MKAFCTRIRGGEDCLPSLRFTCLLILVEVVVHVGRHVGSGPAQLVERCRAPTATMSMSYS